MKCAYCKQTIPEMRDANEEPKERTYTVEINGVECEIWMHDECVCKALGEFFSRPKDTPSSNHYVAVTPLDKQPWQPTWNCRSTVDCPPPDTTRVWCKSGYEDTHSPWKDRVD